MSAILGSLGRATAAGLVLLVLMALALHRNAFAEPNFIVYFIMWTHIAAGILWIGLLWYFNVVQIPTMPKVPAELKPGVTKHIAPAALFWFRWAAVATVVLGLLTAYVKLDLHQVMMLKAPYTTIGIGMWLAIIMALNVWLIIWPNQQRALGLVPAEDAVKAKSAKTAMLASRTNFALSFPMLYCMVMQGSAVTVG